MFKDKIIYDICSHLMQLLIYILVYPLLWLISKLPFKIFYWLSDAVYVLVYHIIGYRKKVVRENLRRVFQSKSDGELKNIEKKFYKHMCDMFLEMIKSISISEDEMKKRFTFTNVDDLLKIQQQNKSVILMCAHYASWEWMNILEKYVDYKGFGVYQLIGNKYFDKLVRSIREKYNTTLIITKKAIKTITENQNKNVLGLYAMVSDQSPQPHKTHHWSHFLGTKVPCFTGAEMLAKKLDMAVVYLHVEKVKRGHYQATFKILATTTNEFKNYEITDAFLKEVEKQVYAVPEYYLWTHKRFKHAHLAK